MRKFLVLLTLAVAFGFFLLSPEEPSEGLILAEVRDPGLDPALFEEADDEQAEPAEPITGRVVRIDGEPVAGARVVLEHAWVPEVSALTGADGEFELTPAERRGELIVRGGSQLLVGGRRTLTESRSEGYIIVVADPVTVRGKVVDITGATVSSARVFGQLPSDALVPFGIASLPVAFDEQVDFTADDGTFELGPLPNLPRSMIEITRQGYQPARVPFPIEAAQEVLIVLDPG